MQAQDDNITWLQRQLGAPLLADIPHFTGLSLPTGPARLAITLPSA
jgi:hypothetical protein